MRRLSAPVTFFLALTVLFLALARPAAAATDQFGNYTPGISPPAGTPAPSALNCCSLFSVSSNCAPDTNIVVVALAGCGGMNTRYYYKTPTRWTNAINGIKLDYYTNFGRWMSTGSLCDGFYVLTNAGVSPVGQWYAFGAGAPPQKPFSHYLTNCAFTTNLVGASVAGMVASDGGSGTNLNLSGTTSNQNIYASGQLDVIGTANFADGTTVIDDDGNFNVGGNTFIGIEGNLNAGNVGTPTLVGSDVWVVQSSELNGGKNIVATNQCRIEMSVADVGTNLVDGMHSVISGSRAGEDNDLGGRNQVSARYSSIVNCKAVDNGTNYIPYGVYGYDSMYNCKAGANALNYIHSAGYSSMIDVQAFNGASNQILEAEGAIMQKVDNDTGSVTIAANAAFASIYGVHIDNEGSVLVSGDHSGVKDVWASNGHYVSVTGNRAYIIGSYNSDCDTVNAGNDSIIFGEGYTNNADHVLVYVTCGQPPVIIDRNTGQIIGKHSGDGQSLTNLDGGNLQPGTVGEGEIADNAVSTDKLQDASFTVDKLAVGFLLPVAALPSGVPTSVTALINTNFPTGTVISNSFGHVIEISANAVLTEAAVAGRSQLSLECVGVKTNRSGQLTIIAGLTGSVTNGIQIKVPVAGNYIFRDTSAGIGNAALVSDGQITVLP